MKVKDAGRRSVKLRVGEIPPNAQEDIGTGIVRIDSSIMNKLGIREGQIVQIKGNRVTAARVLRGYPADIGLGIIRMDGYMRKNAGTSLGEKVEVSPAEFKEAKKVVLSPAEEGIIIQVSDPNIFKRPLLGRVFVQGDIIIPASPNNRRSVFEEMFDMSFDFFGFSLKDTKLKVVSTTPKGIVVVTENTKIEMKSQAIIGKEEITSVPEVTYEDIGGLEEEIKKVREMIELPLKHPEVFQRLGIDPPSGVLLYGPPGTGKTLLAKAVANEANAHFISINGPEIMSKFYGESERRIRELFKEAKENAPSIIFIDEIDAIAPKRDELRGEVERRVVAQLLSLMDGLEARRNVVVIAATNRPNDLDEALRRPGRFDREIEIGVPNRKGRKEILQIHTRNMPLSEDVDLDEIANKTHGYVGADLEALCKEAAMNALRRVLPEINMEEETVPKEVLNRLIITMEDFKKAMNLVEPSALREVLVQVPRVKWEDIGGLENVKKQLKEMVEWPLKDPKSFEKFGINPPRGILLYGLPGTGKTLLAKAVATESEANFISIKGPEVFSKWVGESEKTLRKYFSKARQVAPCVIFIDELESLAPKRGNADSGVSDRVVNQLLIELDGIESLENIVVIAATNRPDMIDPALLRPGRIDKLVYVPLPDEKAREEILKIHTKNMPLSENVDLRELARITNGYSGSDLEALCMEAGMCALRESKEGKKVNKVEKRHFEMALRNIKPSIDENVVKSFEKKVEKLEAMKRKMDYYA